MSEQRTKRRAFKRIFALSLSLLAAASMTDSAWAGPHALVPIAKPHFTIDQASPSIGLPTVGGPITSGAVLDAPGPVVTFPAQGLGLPLPNDELDEVSANRSDVSATDTFVLLFNVDRATLGAVGPDPSLLPNRPYNVLDQAQRHQAAGDTFMTLDAYNRTGGPLSTLRAVAVRNNVLVINEGDTGGGDYDLDPDVSPLMILPPGTPIDGIDGMYYETPAALRGTLESPPFRGVNPPSPGIYFTAKKNSPSLFQLPGTPSGANVYFDPSPLTPLTEALYASASQLGLAPGFLGDDIDGLIVFDGGIHGVLDIGVDEILFSLAPGSPALGGVFSPADLFLSHGNGVFQLYARAIDLGLLATDNVTGLELIKTTDPATTVFNSAIFYVIPGDYDGSGTLTSDDCAQFPDCYTGPGGAASVACQVFDQDADGDVDCTDWKNFIIIYRQLNEGASCPLLTVDEFVAALLDSPLHPAHVCMADMNLDDKTNGRDIPPYVQAFLGS